MILLDTHAWMWWLDAPQRLSNEARQAIDASREVAIASISCWELAMLTIRGRIDLNRDVESWIMQALAHPRANAIALTPEIATQAALLEREGFSEDPADRIIYATARTAGVPLVTRDAAIRDFDPARVIW